MKISKKLGEYSKNGKTWSANLKPNAVSIYIVVVDLNETGEAISEEIITKTCGISRNDVVKALNLLRKHGFIDPESFDVLSPKLWIEF